MALIYKSVLALLVVYVTYVSSAAVPNDLIVGSHQYGETLFYSEPIKKEASKLGAKVIVEKSLNAPVNQLITYVECRDQKKNGAQATVIAGGPGFSFVNLKFKSARFHGIAYNCLIYSKTKF